MLFVGWEESQPDPIPAHCRQWETSHFRKEAVWNLDEYSGAVARVCLGTRCPAMFHTAQRANAHRHDVVRATTLNVDDERDATSVVFKSWVV
jgi:hypothetical protein